jgi:hypothetical protein
MTESEVPTLGLGAEQRQMWTQAVMTMGYGVRERRHALGRVAWSDEHTAERTHERTERIADRAVRAIGLDALDCCSSFRTPRRGVAAMRRQVHGPAPRLDARSRLQHGTGLTSVCLHGWRVLGTLLSFKLPCFPVLGVNDLLPLGLLLGLVLRQIPALPLLTTLVFAADLLVSAGWRELIATLMTRPVLGRLERIDVVVALRLGRQRIFRRSSSGPGVPQPCAPARTQAVPP